MTSSRHTKGNWLISGNMIISDTGKIVVTFGSDYFDPAEMRANMRLVSAAPNLYAALKFELATHRPFVPIESGGLGLTLGIENNKPHAWASRSARAYNIALAAIAKVEGLKP